MSLLDLDKNAFRNSFRSTTTLRYGGMSSRQDSNSLIDKTLIDVSRDIDCFLMWYMKFEFFVTIISHATDLNSMHFAFRSDKKV